MIKATRGYIEGIATALSNGTGIRFKETQQGWFTDVKNKTLNYNPVDLTRLPAFAVKGMILHETGHLKFSSPSEKTELFKKYPVMQDVYNVLEDVRIENDMIRKYGAYATEGFLANNEFHGQGQSSIITPDWQQQSKLRQYLLTMLGFCNANNGKYSSSDLNRQYSKLFNNSTFDVQEKIDETCHDVLSFCVNTATSTKEVQEYCDGILYPKIKEFIEDAPKDEPPMQCQANPTKDRKGIQVSSTGDGKLTHIPDEKDLELLLAPYINTLAKRLDDILKETQATRFTGSHKSGKLLSKNAYKILADDYRAFSKKKTPNKPHYVVTLALDQSGSMQGERHSNSYVATYLIKRACEKLKFPVNLIMFDGRAKKIEKLLQYKTEYSGGGNDERYVIELLKEVTSPNDDNIIFMVTDGGCGYNVKQDVEKFTKQGYLVAAIAVGLEDDHQFVSMLRNNYPMVALAPDVEKLPNIMIDLMRKFIHR